VILSTEGCVRPPNLTIGSEGPSGITGIPGSRSLLLVSDDWEFRRSMAQKARSQGFSLFLGSWLRDIENDYCLESLHAVVLVTGAGTIQLQRTFRVARRLSRVRFRSAKFEPVITIAALSELSPSTCADFLRLGCQVLLRPYPEQLFQLLETMSVENKRRLRNGVKLVLRESLPPIVVHQGLVAELTLRGRLRRLLQELCSENREFGTVELASVIGCDRLQVKIYVERLRREIVTSAREVGLFVTKDEVISNSGRSTGYRLRLDVR
jgi:hypothetical protein